MLSQPKVPSLPYPEGSYGNELPPLAVAEGSSGAQCSLLAWNMLANIKPKPLCNWRKERTKTQQKICSCTSEGGTSTRDQTPKSCSSPGIPSAKSSLSSLCPRWSQLSFSQGSGPSWEQRRKLQVLPSSWSPDLVAFLFSENILPNCTTYQAASANIPHCPGVLRGSAKASREAQLWIEEFSPFLSSEFLQQVPLARTAPLQIPLHALARVLFTHRHVLICSFKKLSNPSAPAGHQNIFQVGNTSLPCSLTEEAELS